MMIEYQILSDIIIYILEGTDEILRRIVKKVERRYSCIVPIRE